MDEYVTQLESVLSRVLNARDSQTVKQATEELSKVWYKQAETVPALIRILQVHPLPQMRQLAGVEVRKLIPRFWYGKDKALSPEVMEQIKASLLTESRQENSDLVRHTVARIISAIARLDLDENRWPQLLPELQRSAVAADVREREIAIYVLYALLDSQDYSAAAAEKPEEMLQLFSQTVKDPESLTVKVNTVLALSGLSSGLSGPQATMFQQFVPEIVQVLRQTVEASDDKSSNLIFESLSELIDADATLLGPAFGELLSHMITDYGLNKHIDPETRVAAMRVVSTATAFRFNRINKLKLAPTLTKQLVQVVANESGNEDEDEDEDDDDELTVQASALQSLETLAARLPPSQVIAPLLHMLPELVHTSNPGYLRAGYLAFSATADGAPEFVSSETETLLPWIVNGLQNGNQSVRVAALYALCQLGDGVGERVGREHATLIPLVYSILDSASSIKVCRSACYALATILRTLKNEVLTTEYLPGLVPRLLEVVGSSPNLELKGFVISTIGTAAEVAGRNYLPYFNQTITVLEPFVGMPPVNPQTNEIDPAQARLVSEALGTLSRLCCAIGAEQFSPYLEAWMKTALECLNSKDATLREMAPLYISELAEVYKVQFGIYVPHIVPHLFEVLNQEEITYEDVDGLADALDSGEADLDLENLDTADLTDGLKVNSALCIEKEYSLDCLGSLWQYVPADPAMLPFLQPSLEHFRNQTEHFYEEVRISAITGLWRMLQASPQNTEVKEATWSATTEVLETDGDIGVVSNLLDLLSESIKDFGGLAVFPDTAAVELVLTNVLDIVKKTHRVFDEFADDEIEDAEDQETAGEESSEAAAHLVQTSLELLSRVATVMGAEFAPLFEKVASALQPYATSAVDSERETGVGAFADLVGAMEANITPWTGVLIQAFSAALSDSAIGVRSVAAYGVGLLAACSTDSAAVQASYSDLLDKLARLLSDGGDDRAVANGAGAVARLALRYPQAVPIPAPQLAEQLLTVLPLKDAYEEYPPILQFLSTTQVPVQAKSVFEALWKQHLEAQHKDAVKSVNYLPADDPLGNDVAMQAWQICAQQVGLNL